MYPLNALLTLVSVAVVNLPPIQNGALFEGLPVTAEVTPEIAPD